MGYKAPAIHRVGTYSTDCNCKVKYFAKFREARRHCDECNDALNVFYNGGQTPIVAYSKPIALQ